MHAADAKECEVDVRVSEQDAALARAARSVRNDCLGLVVGFSDDLLFEPMDCSSLYLRPPGIHGIRVVKL